MKRAVLSTRNRKDGAFGEDEDAVVDRMASGESEREETQPASPGDLLWLQEDTDKFNTGENSSMFANGCFASNRHNLVYLAMK